MSRKTTKPENEGVFFTKMPISAPKLCCKTRRTPLLGFRKLLHLAFSSQSNAKPTLRTRASRGALGGFRRRRAGREVGGLARVLCGSLPACPSPSPRSYLPPSPFSSPVSSPTLPTPRVLRPACLLSFPARSIRVADGCL